MFSQHSTRAEPARSRADADGSDRIGMDPEWMGSVEWEWRRWSGHRRFPGGGSDGGGGQARGPVGPVGPVGSRKLAAAPGRTRAGQEDGGGVGGGEQRSGVRRSSRRSRLRSAGIGAQRAARSRIVAVRSAVTSPASPAPRRRRHHRPASMGSSTCAEF